MHFKTAEAHLSRSHSANPRKREWNDGSFLSSSVSTLSKHKSDNQNYAPNEISSELQISDNVRLRLRQRGRGLITQNSRGRGMILMYQSAERWCEDCGGSVYSYHEAEYETKRDGHSQTDSGWGNPANVRAT